MLTFTRPGSDTQVRSPIRPPHPAEWAPLLLCAVLTPAVAAIWWVPWFVTQDGPAHVYNAQILADSVGGFDRTSPWHDVYTVRWQPIPNWAGPIVLAALVTLAPGLAGGSSHDQRDLGRVCRRHPLAAVARGGRERAFGRGRTGGATCHEHGLAVRIYELHARGLPVPDHARTVVAGPRSLEPSRT